MVGAIGDPADGKAVAHTIYLTVLVYIAFAVCCGGQAWLNVRDSRRGVQLQ